MAGITIENGGCLKELLRLLGAADWDCRWLITELECYDTCGWEGGERWTAETLFLSNRDFLRDVERRDMQFVWGILSAVPARYGEAEVRAAGCPRFEIDKNGESCYLADTLLPRHPLAFLEIACEDSTTVTVIGRDGALLRPLFQLPERTEDAEAHNRRWHALICIGTAVLAEWGLARRVRRGGAVRDRLGRVWWALYRHHPERPIQEADIRAELLHQMEEENGHAGE